MIRYLPVLLVFFFAACGETTPTETPGADAPAVGPLTFVERTVTDSARLWWARTTGDVDRDGLLDVIYQDNNGFGGRLGYMRGQKGDQWEDVVVAETAPNGLGFAGGDLEAGDFDGDGDLDLFAIQHPGEWKEAGADAQLYWYENPTWKAHDVGTAPDAVKDVTLADFDGDGQLDVAILTFDEHKLQLYGRAEKGGAFSKMQTIQHTNLHEGMDFGDLDGDGDLDIAANGYTFTNPGTLTGEWAIGVIDAKWHNQDGDWSANGTKTRLVDFDKDGRSEVLISHSERGGYPLSWYGYNPATQSWEEHVVIDSFPAAHTLEVADMDLDGDLDIVSGINVDRAVNLEPKVEDGSVYVFLNDGNNFQWARKRISDKGIYNGQLADYDGDGDVDLFRLPGHMSRSLYLMENQVIQ